MDTIKNSEKYKDYFNNDFLMGPNSIRLLDELLLRCPIKNNGTILDLGCGTGLTSLFIANETNSTVYANDLWISREANLERFKKWNMENRIIPINEDANCLDFEREFFDAVISIDAYHYFAGQNGFFENKILPFVKRGGEVLIVVPGVKEEYEGHRRELLSDWLGDEYYMFHSCSWWSKVIGDGGEIECVHTWEMNNFEIAWEEWLKLTNRHADGDRVHYKDIIAKYTNFVGLYVRKKNTA